MGCRSLSSTFCNLLLRTDSVLASQTDTIGNATTSTTGSENWPLLGVLLATSAVTAWLYWDVFRWLNNSWASNADYSHGYFVPVFAAYLLWSTREKMPQSTSASSGLLVGGGCMLLALLLRLAGGTIHVITLEGLSLIPYVIGLASILGGLATARWILAPAVFLAFMIPLPGFLAGQLSDVLQTVATQTSTFALQTVGVPALAEGHIISLSNGQIGVAEACSGLRMLYAFFALTVGACILIERTWIEKLLIALSAVPIAILANCIRIFVTGLAFEYIDPETAEHIFHDVAGWLMMPLGFAILMVVLAILDRAIIPAPRDGALSH